jgi:hypothetical protein
MLGKDNELLVGEFRIPQHRAELFEFGVFAGLGEPPCLSEHAGKNGTLVLQIRQG